MLLWIVMAALTAAASLAILVPLYRGRPRSRPDGAEKLSIYRDQLAELDRDLARGLIAESEADAARTEIARRLLRADEAAGAEEPKGERGGRLGLAAALGVMPIVALGTYLLVGSPWLPDQPLAARLDAATDQQDVAALIARVETHLATNPEDGRGWELLGPVYIRLGRLDDAVRAFSNALRILGPTAEREANLGEAITRANDNIVTQEARAAFERALARDATAVRPRFYLAVALDQEGRREEALAAWKDLLQGAPEGAAWVSVARDAVARLEGAPAPTEDDVAAAAGMSEQERTAMIGGMVDSLAAKLEADPSDAEGWARLLRSYMVLGRKDEAQAALEKARTALASDATRLGIVEAEARSQGLIE